MIHMLFLSDHFMFPFILYFLFIFSQFIFSQSMFWIIPWQIYINISEISRSELHQYDDMQK